MNKQKVIIDTDPGVDDAIAILYALNHPNIDLVGLTTVFGNLATVDTTRNALTLLEHFGHPQIPVAMGEKQPLEKVLTGYAEFVHGENGLGNIDIQHSRNLPIESTAAEFIVEQVLKHPNEITICAIAPLTNLAKALELEPKIAQLVKQIVIMGGAISVNGNVTPVAEANIFNDPHAADIVLTAGWPITVIGLDATLQVFLDDAFITELKNKSYRCELLYNISRFYVDFYRMRDGLDGIVCHDATALTYITNPELFTCINGRMRVSTEGISDGMTILDSKMNYGFHNAWTNMPIINASLGVDANGIKELLKNNLY
jgi:inosine-uridine nucleoside N-ribohydrolase